MSLSTVDTILIIKELPIEKLLYIIEDFFSKYKFEYKTDFENYWLEETNNSQNMEAISIEINSKEDAKYFFERLKKHSSGGTINYFSSLLKSSVLFSLQSINANGINVLIFYFDKFDQNKIIPFFHELSSILDIQAVFCGEESDSEWDEQQIIESALLGHINKKYLMSLNIQ